MTVTEEPKSSEEINLGGVVLEGTNDEAVLTGLGPLKNNHTLMIKQKIQTCEILTGCEQENRWDMDWSEPEKEKNDLTNQRLPK